MRISVFVSKSCRTVWCIQWKHNRSITDRGKFSVKLESHGAVVLSVSIIDLSVQTGCASQFLLLKVAELSGASNESTIVRFPTAESFLWSSKVVVPWCPLIIDFSQLGSSTLITLLMSDREQYSASFGIIGAWFLNSENKLPRATKGRVQPKNVRALRF